MKQFLIFLICCAAIFIYVRYIERRSVFFPYKALDSSPESLGLDFKDVNVKTADGQMLSAWWVPEKTASSTVYFFHGNGGNLSHRLEKISFFNSLGLNVFILDYRGYGLSSGVPTESGLYIDAQAGYEYLTGVLKIRPSDIILFGESLGSAVAVELAARRPVKAIILEGAFSSEKEMAKRIYPMLPAFLLKFKFDSISKISAIKIPKLFIQSRNDEVVPYDLGRKLYMAAGEPKSFLEISGGHNDSFYAYKDTIKSRIKRFLDEK